jgi:hypothetical protein
MADINAIIDRLRRPKKYRVGLDRNDDPVYCYHEATPDDIEAAATIAALQSEIARMREALTALTAIHECRPDVTRDDYEYAYRLAHAALSAPDVTRREE